MPNKPVPAAGEAMPSTSIARRTFLMGAAAAAVAVPTVTSAASPAIIDGGIATLVSQHAAAKEAVRTAADFAFALWDVPDRVESAFVAASEFSPLVYAVSSHAMVGGRCIKLQQVNAVVDFYIEERRRHYNWMAGGDGQTAVTLSAASAASLADRIAKGEADRARATTIFNDRYAAHKAWKIRSGVAAADAECDRLFAIEEDLGNRIFQFECQSVDDVRIKAGWLVEEYGDEMSAEASFKIMRQFASIKTEAGR